MRNWNKKLLRTKRNKKKCGEEENVVFTQRKLFFPNCGQFSVVICCALVLLSGLDSAQCSPALSPSPNSKEIGNLKLILGESQNGIVSAKFLPLDRAVSVQTNSNTLLPQFYDAFHLTTSPFLCDKAAKDCPFKYNNVNRNANSSDSESVQILIEVDDSWTAATNVDSAGAGGGGDQEGYLCAKKYFPSAESNGIISQLLESDKDWLARNNIEIGFSSTDQRPFLMQHMGPNSKFAIPKSTVGGGGGVLIGAGRVAVPPAVKQRSVRNSGSQEATWSTMKSGNHLQINGFRIETSDRDPSIGDENVPEVMSGTHVQLRLFGSGFTPSTVIVFTEEHNEAGGPCQLTVTEPFLVVSDSITVNSVLVNVILPKSKNVFYFCAKDIDNSTTATRSALQINPFIHQGSNDWMRLKTYELPLPAWMSIVIICICLMFSALFSGLNLGLMSLDRTELKILKNTGTEKERRYAAKIQPVRDHGNYLLCSILLGNVLVNSTFTILLDGLTSGLIAVVCSTLAIVIFGEITPQAICSRHGLAVGAKTIYITKVVMAITAPLAWPTSKMLDWLLGEEIGNVYNRERLKELVRVTKDINDLDKDEVNIISGALELRKKTVGDVMTHIEDAFMLNFDAVLDFETVSEIMKSGYSRIPVYDKERANIVTLLYIKDLAFVDPDDNTPLKTLCEFYQNPCHFVFEDVTLDVMFKQFKEGHKGHMAFVHRVNNEGDGDPFYETIGLITLEDVIEELIQAEIMDETDVFTDNRTKVKRMRIQRQDFTVFAERREGNHRIRISPQLTLATFQYLSTAVDAFKKDLVSETILRRLLNQDVIHHIKYKGKDRDDPSLLIYQQGKPVDFFVLILEGRVEVTVGKENLVFESGPFTYFGTQALVQNVVVVDSPQQPNVSQHQIMGSLQSLNMDALLKHTFVPDYSVRAVMEVVYIAIKRPLYMAAKRATLMERSQKVGDQSSEVLDDEVEKLLHSLDEDDRSLGADTVNLMTQTPKLASKQTSNVSSPTNQRDDLANGRMTPINVRSYSIPNQSTGYKSTHIMDEGSEMPLLPRSKS